MHTGTAPRVPDLIASCWTAGGNADARGGRTPSPVDLRTRIEAAGRAGWRGFGLLHADLVQARDTIGYADVRRMLDDNGIRHVELEFLQDWWATGESRTESDRIRADLFAVVEPLGARHIKVGPGMRGEPVEPEAMRENWSALCEEASGYGVWLALESQPYSYFPTVESTIQLVSEVDHPSGGILVDIWHAYRSGLDYGDMVALIPKRYLHAVELADAKAEVVGTLFEDTINNRELCGEGDADVEAFIRAIDRIGYDGPWGVEIISHAHRARPIDEALTRAFDTAAASFRSARG